MRAQRLQELEEMAAELLATARKLPPGPNRHNALLLIGSSPTAGFCELAIGLKTSYLSTF
jgi:hypothetical protein